MAAQFQWLLHRFEKKRKTFTYTFYTRNLLYTFIYTFYARTFYIRLHIAFIQETCYIRLYIHFMQEPFIYVYIYLLYKKPVIYVYIYTFYARTFYIRLHIAFSFYQTKKKTSKHIYFSRLITYAEIFRHILNVLYINNVCCLYNTV